MKSSRLSIWLVALFVACNPVAPADPPTKTVPSTKPGPPPKSKASPGYETLKNHDPDGIGKFYMGREIAQVMGHEAAGWLDRPEREKEEQSSNLLKALDLKNGDIVADIGAGTGYFSFPMAAKVAPKGKVLAVEIQQEMLDIIAKRMKERKVENIDLILGTETDPKLRDGSVDLMLLVDVYHEFSDPYAMIVTMVKALKPGGRLVFVEFRAEDEKVPIKPVHKMSEKQVKKEMALHPLKYVKTIETLPWQHVIIFEREK
ncbi:MAG: class I SAM-dependent methyltransferase [Gemmataceae bacterium]